ncbi:MAG TPA: endopeptidase La [Paludibacteraceae bacterium]|nr:endopeptidase La [Paludibacteraceae bacterium]HQF51046.1 endopeptidase La [Paludibacteraceae bacterium]
MTTKIKDIFLETERENESDFIPLISDGDDSFEFKEGENENLSILALRNMVLFPGVVMPVSLGRKKSLLAVRNAYKKGIVIGVFAQKDEKVDDPLFDDLYHIGTVAQVIKVLEMPDGTTSAILQGKRRISMDSITDETPYLKGTVTPLADNKPNKVSSKEFKVLVETLKEAAIKLIKGSSSMPPEVTFAVKNIENANSLINFICANFGLKLKEKQSLLETDDVQERGYELLSLLNKELQMLEIKLSIQSRTQEEIEQQQKEYYLQQQIKAIQTELGGDSQSKDIEEFNEKALHKKWSKEVAEIFEKELTKLERLSVHSPEYGVQSNYVETIVSLPWNEYSKDSLNLKHAQRILDRDHFGLEQVKERILEHLAVLKLKNDLKSPIICLYGPPGVGKTSLGKSVAESLKRKYVRISLGGLNDESEIRGHRRTYIGAMPGRIIQSLQKAGTSNPVFILDEIDKVSSDFKGDPAAALLEVLDPEQNNTFHDNFLDIDYDLSKVMFIATANNLSTISQPLLDRMEIIEIPGYILEEKVEIATRHLIPKELENHGIGADQLSIPKETIVKIIDSYTRESGVRELDKQITKIMRKIAFKIAVKEEYNKLIKPEELAVYLGMERFSKDKYEGNEYVGVVTGLAWTAVGGEILFVETSLSKSKTSKLTLTGNLGDVMKESAVLALEYLRAHAEKFGIDPNMFEDYSIHIHVPEGAIPKDGPSAGVTMTTSLASAFTKRKVRKHLAMTGEITLRGKVLPVGGIKEKILAAKRAGIKDIILCEENRKDIADIKDSYIKGLTFHYVKDIEEVLNFALLDEKVKD